ncbi:hypothetical protein ACQ4PT_019906 [Festuca glaucescens]
MSTPSGSSSQGEGGYYLMSCIKDVPTLRGDNYTEWRKKVDFAFVCAEVDWVLETPQPTKPADPVRDDKDDDDAWDGKKKDHAPVEMAYTLENRKWQTTNKKCMAFIKNTIENAIVGSIAECASVGEYLEKIKSQFTGSSKTYATQLLKQLVTENYTGGGHGIREHILRMSNLAAKLKPIDDDLELKPALLVHLVMASLPAQFDNFVVNYNMNPEKWDIEKTIAMYVQEEDRLKAQNGGSLNYVKDNKKMTFTPSNNGSPSKPYAKGPMQHHQQYQHKPILVNKYRCLHCKKTEHYKKNCPDWLKELMAKRDVIGQVVEVGPIKEVPKKLRVIQLCSLRIEDFSLQHPKFPIVHHQSQQESPAAPAEESRSISKRTQELRSSWRTIKQLESLDPFELPENARFLCKVSLVKIDCTNGWCYRGCFDCKRSISQNGSEVWCSQCASVNKKRKRPVWLYELDAVVEDATGTMNLMIFDEEAMGLIGVAAEDLVDEITDENRRILPHAISVLVGSTHAFGVAINERSLGCVAEWVLNDDQLMLLQHSGSSQMTVGGDSPSPVEEGSSSDSRCSSQLTEDLLPVDFQEKMVNVKRETELKAEDGALEEDAE